MAKTGVLTYWGNGLPYVAEGQAAAFKYWFDGLPAIGQDNIVYAYLRPSATDAAGGWKDQSGGTSLSASLDETIRDDADYIYSNDPATDVCRVDLASASSIDGDQDVYVKYALGANASGRIDFTVRLKQVTTVIATWTHTGVDSTVMVYSQTLTSVERAAVDWDTQSTLKLEFEANKP